MLDEAKASSASTPPAGAATDGEAGDERGRALSDVVISYAREDLEFTRLLTARLGATDRDVWVDLVGIPPSAAWWEEIQTAIDSAHAVVFVLSPAWVNSDVTHRELDHALKAGKRIIPLVHRDVPKANVPEALATRNWILWRSPAEADEAFEQLGRALDTDFEWVNDHTRLHLRAVEWESNERNRSYLLRGQDLATAEHWLRTAPGHEPSPTHGQVGFLMASRQAAARAQRRILGVVGFGLVIALSLAIVALVQRNRADEQRAMAEARTEEADFQRLLSQAVNLSETDRSLAFLLALEADQLRSSAQSRSALFTTLQRQEDFLGYTPTDGVPTGATRVDDATLCYVTNDARVGLVDLDTGEALGASQDLGPRPDGPIQMFAATDTGRQRDDPLVVARADTGQIWRIDPTTGQAIGEPIESGHVLFGVAASARHGLIAVPLEDGTVKLWDLDTGEAVGELAGPAHPPAWPFEPGVGDYTLHTYIGGVGDANIGAGDAIAVAFSTTRPEVAVERAEGAVEFWAFDAPEPARVVPAPGPALSPAAFGFLAYRPDGDQVILYSPMSASNDALRAINPRSGSVDWTSPMQQSDFLAAYTPDGTALYTIEGNEEIRVRSTATGEISPAVASTGLSRAAYLDTFDEGRELVVASAATASVGRWVTAGSSAIVRRFGGPSSRPLEFSPDGQSLLVVTGPQALGGDHSVWDPRRGRRLAGLPVLVAAFAGDGTLAAFFNDLTAGFFDLDTEERIEPQLDLSLDGIYALANAKRRGLLAVGYEDGRILFFDRSGESPGPGLEPASGGIPLGFSADGALLAVGRTNDRIDVLEVATGEQRGPPVQGLQAAFIGQSDHLVTGSINGGLREVDTATGETIGEPFARVPPAISLESDDAGASLAHTDYSGRVRLFDIASRTPIGIPITGSDSLGYLTYATLTPAGDLLALAGPDGVEVWDLDPDHWRVLACRLAGRNLTVQEWETNLPNAGHYQPTCPDWPAGG